MNISIINPGFEPLTFSRFLGHNKSTSSN